MADGNDPSPPPPKMGGLFELGAALLYEERIEALMAAVMVVPVPQASIYNSADVKAAKIHNALLQFARSHKISLRRSDWRRSAELVALDEFLCGGAKKKRGRPKKVVRRGLFATPSDERRDYLDLLDGLTHPSKDVEPAQYRSDAAAIKFLIRQLEFGGRDSLSAAQEALFESKCASMRVTVAGWRKALGRQRQPRRKIKG